MELKRENQFPMKMLLFFHSQQMINSSSKIHSQNMHSNCMMKIQKNYLQLDKMTFVSKRRISNMIVIVIIFHLNIQMVSKDLLENME